MKDFEEEDVKSDEILKIVDEIKVLFEKDRYIDSIKDLKKDYPSQIEKLEETLLSLMGEIDPKNLKTEIPDNWKFLI